MSGLSSRDVKVFNEAALELHSTQSAEEFPRKIFQAIRKMIPGEIVVVDWIHPKTSVSFFCQYFPRHEISDELNALAHILLPSQSPFWLKCADEPCSVSDFLPRTQWSKRDIFQALSEVSQEDCLCLDIPLTPSLTLMLVDVRSSYGSYVSSDRLKLKLLGPHVKQVYRRLVAQGNPMADADLVLRRAQVSLDEESNRCLWSKEARELLAAQGILVLDDELPSAVKHWFLVQRSALEKPSEVTQGTQPLKLSRGTRSLTLYLKRKPEGRAYWLLLEERETSLENNRIFPGLNITRRESEVLFWVSHGKSNTEIATILGVSIGTVGRHLENIFFKLGVENRYAASLIATRVLASKAQAAVAGRK